MTANMTWVYFKFTSHLLLCNLLFNVTQPRGKNNLHETMTEQNSWIKKQQQKTKFLDSKNWKQSHCQKKRERETC